MASPSTGSSLDTTPTSPASVSAPPSAAGAPANTAQLDRLCEKAVIAQANCRYALAAGLCRRAAEEALCLHGDTFVCTFLTLQRAVSLCFQAQLEGVTNSEVSSLRVEAWELASSCLPLIVGRMDANTMLPGRGTAVELAFFKRFVATKVIVYDKPWSTRSLQLISLSLGYVTALLGADVLLGLLCARHDSEAEAFVLRVVDCMLPAARSVADVWIGEELAFASTIQHALSGAFTHDAAFVASLRTKWMDTAMIQMRRQRHLLDASEKTQTAIDEFKTTWHADVAQHGLKHCALPSCDKREVCVRQFGCYSRCRSDWYCSAEHGTLHWKEHKPICRATTAAQQAADDAGAGAA